VDGIDSSTWSALGLTLTLLGLLLSVLLWRRRGAATGVRAVAWSLLPAAAGLTGTLRLLWGIGEDVASWAVRLVFSPVVWIGLVLAGISVVLFVVSGAMRARGSGGARAREVEAGGPTPAAKPPKGRAKPAVGDEDMDDIEAILRKHGIQ